VVVGERVHALLIPGLREPGIIKSRRMGKLSPGMAGGVAGWTALVACVLPAGSAPASQEPPFVTEKRGPAARRLSGWHPARPGLSRRWSWRAHNRPITAQQGGKHEQFFHGRIPLFTISDFYQWYVIANCGAFAPASREATLKAVELRLVTPKL